MTPEQQRKMLECAAKACGIDCWYQAGLQCFGPSQRPIQWNPLTRPNDTAEMCAELGIDWRNFTNSVDCSAGWATGHAKLEDHNNIRLKAWMHAATLVAAKTQGYEE